jgi:hypothetical protein
MRDLDMRIKKGLSLTIRNKIIRHGWVANAVLSGDANVG